MKKKDNYIKNKWNLNKTTVILISLLIVNIAFIVVLPKIDSAESFSITWEVKVACDPIDGLGDDAFFGEAPDANDGPPVDSYDVLHPPPRPAPHIYAWFDDGLPYPFDKLRKDYRTYPDTDKTWDLYVKWDGSGSTTVTISWSITEAIGSGYDNIDFCNNIGTILKDMTTQNSYSYTASDGSTTHFKIICHKNNPPNIPSNPDPYDGELDVEIDAILSWNGGDPDGDPVTYDVYFGTTSPPSKQVSNQSSTIYDPGTMDNDKTYYWKIIAWDSYYASSEGAEWHFTTEMNNPPNTPFNPDPYDGEIDVEINADLYWDGGDPDGDPVTYDVYFGTTNPPSKVTNNQSDNSYNPGTMDIDETYYWRIVAWDDNDASASGPIWSFTTKTNQPPDFGEPTPINGSNNQPVEYLTWKIPIYDIEGDNFNWIIECNNGQSTSGNNDINGTKTLHLSNLDFLTTYIVWVNATDPYGSETYNKEYFTFTTCDGPYEIVYVDDNYHSLTPGFGCDHFITVQDGVDRVDDGGVVYVMDGVYGENVEINADTEWSTGRSNLIIQGEGLPIDTTIIDGTIIVNADFTTIENLRFEPTTDPAITINGNNCEIHYCVFDHGCNPNSIGVYANENVDAEYNWWGASDGPNGGQMDDGLTADGYGVQVIGPVLVEPWVGVHAEATASSYSVETGEVVIFNAAGSFAADFSGTYEPQYYWTFESGRHSDEKQPVSIFDSPGTYEVSLRVQGNGIAGLHSNFMYDWAYLIIEVTNPSAPLSVNADGGHLGGYETIIDESLTLQGRASGGTTPYIYYWNLGDGTTSNEQNPIHTYTSENIYTVTLTVTDDKGNIASDTATVIVHGIEELVVSIDGPYNAVAENPVYFNSFVSGGVEPYSYEWNFGDGSTSTDANPIHTYNFEGTYTLTLTVTDNEDNKDTSTTKISVDAAEEVVEIIEVKGGFGVKATIKAGDMTAEWSINIDGFVFFGGDTSGIIPKDTEKTVKLPITFAFGKVDITVTADWIQETYSAFALGPFFFNIEKS